MCAIVKIYFHPRVVTNNHAVTRENITFYQYNFAKNINGTCILYCHKFQTVTLLIR